MTEIEQIPTRLEVLDAHGAAVPIERLWSGGTTVLAFVRHFG